MTERLNWTELNWAISLLYSRSCLISLSKFYGSLYRHLTHLIHFQVFIITLKSILFCPFFNVCRFFNDIFFHIPDIGYLRFLSSPLSLFYWPGPFPCPNHQAQRDSQPLHLCALRGSERDRELKRAGVLFLHSLLTSGRLSKPPWTLAPISIKGIPLIPWRLVVRMELKRLYRLLCIVWLRCSVNGRYDYNYY